MNGAFRFLAGVALAGICVFGGSGVALAEDAAVLAAKFGALESVRQISISPDGQKVAYIATRNGGGAVLSVVDLGAAAANVGVPKPILAQRTEGQTLESCDWATDERLICVNSMVYDYSGYLMPIERLFALNADGSKVARLSADTGSDTLGFALYGGGVIDWDLPGKPNHVLMTRYYVPKVSVGSNVTHEQQGLGVEEVDVDSLQRHNVEHPFSEAYRYITDGHGTVRVMGVRPMRGDDEMGNEINYSYRAPNSREWKRLSKVTIDASGLASGFQPVAVDGAKNVVYGFDSLNGFDALYSIALDGTDTRQLVLAKDGIDVDELVRLGRDRRVVGASFATDIRRSEFFDPDLKKLAAGLTKALPGQPSITLFGASADESKILLLASSDVDPGTFYRFDKAARQLSPLLPVRAELAGMTLGAMKPITFPAADGTQIPGYLTLPPGSTGKGLPAIIMPHGGPASRDEWGFDWLVQFYVARGYAVLQPNYRGSTGFGAEWYRQNGWKSWHTAIGDVNDAGRWLAAQGIAAPGKLAIVGWSYGGYAALQSAVLDPDLFKAIVAVAPVTDLASYKLEKGTKMARDFVGTGPHVQEGSPAQNAAAIKAPVLLFHGDHDINVDIGESRMMNNRLKAAGKQVTFVEFPGLDHQLADSAARTRLLVESDAFLRKAMGLQP
ncbi:S9 family peptidase [Novosphingobium sp. FKTRR1]|uniref:S9 family peptidase n=1 Tax=Novosphingobium sp. FKTRR1 TaxID=2879118 RepID=UPI001CF04A27|nr:S9 family peptidase [Novosphingobium sp. FKTRR1]